MSECVLFTDGASRGNPGPASFGFVLFEGDQRVGEGYGKLGHQTNNYAEYMAVIRGLEKCLEMGRKQVVLKSDSQFLVRQLLGQYKVKAPTIQPLFAQAKALTLKFEKFTALHVPREENTLADALANLALDT